MRLNQIGEFNLIDMISQDLRYGRDVIKGVGDDTAVIKYKKDEYLLFTTDMFIEGVHFKSSSTKISSIGRKALAANISDIAAMGGIPLHCVVALGAPPGFSAGNILALYKGIKALAKEYKIGIVGGDTVRSKNLVINISLIGRVRKRNLVLRNGAKEKDAIFVTGSLGGSLSSGRHLTFEPRLKEARYLVRNFKITSMIDTSDGLASDIKRIMDSSKVGAKIDEGAIPRNKACSVNDALFDGEDFELLFTAAKKYTNAIIKKWPFKIKLTKIGDITKRRATLELLTKKGLKRITEEGFRHFK